MTLTIGRQPLPVIRLLIGLAVCPCLFAGKEYLAGPGEKIAPDELLVGLQPGADINRVLGSIAPRERSRSSRAANQAKQRAHSPLSSNEDVKCLKQKHLKA